MNFNNELSFPHMLQWGKNACRGFFDKSNEYEGCRCEIQWYAAV